jgi:hypothetical protein
MNKELILSSLFQVICKNYIDFVVLFGNIGGKEPYL